jgi:hypothetical protein
MPAAWDDLDADRQGVMHTVSSIINVTNVHVAQDDEYVENMKETLGLFLAT